MKKFMVMFFVLMLMSTVVCAANFTDTQGLNCEYAVDNIEYLGIVNGTGDNKFEPNKSVTRAELSKMVTGIVAQNNGTTNKSFPDVEGHWGRNYIAKAASLGILNGYSDGTFKPDNSVTYAEAIAIIMRCMGYNDLEKNVGGTWYANYISKMKEIGLNSGLGEFAPTASANRGDIAIILWNMLISESRADKNITMLEEYFSGLKYWKDVKITDIDTYNGKVIYITQNGNFYVENDIDFSDLGGLVSGFYDAKNNVLIGMSVDAGKNYKKVFGSLKAMTEEGYEVFTCDNIAGYGDKVYAEYIEIFLDEDSNEVMRVVFYDTRESHFAEKIKVGDTRVTIESRDVYDQSIVQLKNGKTITYNILRTESVMDVSINAILVHDNEIVEWDSVPNDSVVREIVKGKIYTYTHKFVDGIIENGKSSYKTLIMNNVEYDVAEECICQSSKTKQTMKLQEGLTRENIRDLSENDDGVRVYLNEFDEIVKVVFNYDVWEIAALQEREEEYTNLEEHLLNIGFVTRVEDYIDDYGKKDGLELRVLSLPKEKNKLYNVDKTDFEIGDFVYLPSGEEELEAVSNKLKIDTLEVILGYNREIVDNKIGSYTIEEDTQIVEVVLMKDENNDDEYVKCTLSEKEVDQLYNYKKYMDINLIVNEDGVVVRLYAVRKAGGTITVGTIKDIQETISGDVVLETKIILYTEDKSTKEYSSAPVMGYDVGDLVTFEIVSKNKDKNNVKDKDKELDSIRVKEVYNHENIGNKYDLIVDGHRDGRIAFKNSDIIMDMNTDSFEYNGEVYYFDEYVFINVDVVKDKETGEWNFTNFKVNNDKNKFTLRANNRVAINEINGTIIAYAGYKEY